MVIVFIKKLAIITMYCYFHFSSSERKEEKLKLVKFYIYYCTRVYMEGHLYLRHKNENGKWVFTKVESFVKLEQVGEEE